MLDFTVFLKSARHDNFFHPCELMSACVPFIKVGEAPRPSTYVKPKPPPPNPKDHDEAWRQKSLVPDPEWVTETAIDDFATATAKAWMSHPANKMQLGSFQKEYDADGDGVTNAEEFKALLKGVGSNADAAILFAAMDSDGDGVLTDAEIKALGQDPTNRARKA